MPALRVHQVRLDAPAADPVTPKAIRVHQVFLTGPAADGATPAPALRVHQVSLAAPLEDAAAFWNDGSAWRPAQVWQSSGTVWTRVA